MPSPIRFNVIHRALTKAGWVLDRVSGSHHIYKRADGTEGTISIPVHNKEVKHGYVKYLKAKGVELG